MAEPGRKINKGARTPNLSVVPSTLPLPVAQSEFAERTMNAETPLIFWSLNQDDPYLVDLTEFATGRTAADVTNGKHLWRGDYRGRPSLITELVPVIKHLYGLNRAASLVVLQDTLRAWWRVFEYAESPEATGGYISSPVESVADLQMLHHHIAKKLGVANTTHNQFVRIANFVRAQKKLLPLHWPAIERETIRSEVPETREVERIRHALKRQWFDALGRWRAADATKVDLWAWKKTPYTEREIHALEVYRAVVEHTGHPLPSSGMVREAIGLRVTPEWMWPYSTLVSRLYPVCDDVRAAFVLCLIYTGWNISTLVDLNIEDRLVEVHPTSPDYHVVYGFKERGQSEHHCIGRNKRSDAPGTILRTLIERTGPLRELVRQELAMLDDQLADGAVSSVELEQLLKQRNVLLKRLRSPWLYADPHNFRVLHLTGDTVNQANKSTYLRNLIQAINLRQPLDKKIRENIVLSDLRDSYIGFAYEFSNYSVLTAKTAAGHKSVVTTQGYLRHKQWKAHSAKAIHKFQIVMFREIEERKSVDPTILRAHMDWNGVADQERARLAEYRKNRSRIGVGCKDPTSPPLSLAPAHTGGGCRVQRCTLCPENAILLPDSYDGIAMRVAELEFLRNNTPVTVWVNSSFPEELANAESVLERYGRELVEERLAHWRVEIETGRHKPITWEGEY